MQGVLTLQQIKSKIRKHQQQHDNTILLDKYHNTPSATWNHYQDVASNTLFTYGRNRHKWQDSLCTRLRLGFKYYWELGVTCDENDKKCTLCNDPRSHTLKHYLLDCDALSPYRNTNINNVTDQVVWMFEHGKVDEMLRKCKGIVKLLK